MRGAQKLLVPMTLTTFVALTGCLPPKPRQARPELPHLRQGAIHLARGELDRAEANFSVAVEYDRRSAEAYNGLALVALARGERRRARRLFVKALALNEDLSEAQNNLGVLELKQGRLRRAARRFRAALAVDPGYHQARYNLGRALYEAGRFAEARKSLLIVTGMRPQLAAAWVTLSLTSAALKRLAAAGRALRRAARLAPGSVGVLVARGVLQRAGGDLAGALRSHGAACRKAPGDLTARMQHGLTLIAAARYRQARSELRRVLAGRPFAARVHFALGYLAARHGDLRDAEKAFRRAAELAPRFAAARLHLAATQVGSGRRRAARRTCRGLRKLLGDERAPLVKRCFALVARRR